MLAVLGVPPQPVVGTADVASINANAFIFMMMVIFIT